MRACAAASLCWQTTRNLLIEGENLEVLRLLRKEYRAAVRLIYIDPPYNTGREFIYRDRFQDTPHAYLRATGRATDPLQPTGGERETRGRFHTRWLNMMYPRLMLARELLHEAGLIAISIDHHELANLKLMCDELFGREHLLALVTRPTGTSTGGTVDSFVSEVDYLLLYRRSHAAKPRSLPLSERDARIYNRTDGRGRYLIRSLRRTGTENRRGDRPNMFYALTAPDGTRVLPRGPAKDGGYESRWVCSRQTYERLEAEGRIEWLERPTKPGAGRPAGKEWKVYQKFYLAGHARQPSDLWSGLAGNKQATRELRTLFDGHKVFDHPKPTALIERLLEISNCRDREIVLDFFAGSGTTGAAIQARNAARADNLRFILVQLAEETALGSGARNAGFRTLSEVCAERLRRNYAQLLPTVQHCNADLGFRWLRLERG